MNNNNLKKNQKKIPDRRHKISLKKMNEVILI